MNHDHDWDAGWDSGDAEKPYLSCDCGTTIRPDDPSFRSEWLRAWYGK